MIYLDNAASSLVSPQALKAHSDLASKAWLGANPNSLHAFGRQAAQSLENSRKILAELLGARRPSEIIFCSGGTEADNMALLGIAQGLIAQGSKRRIIYISALEHEAVASCKKSLEQLGFNVKYLPLKSSGLIDLESCKRLFEQDSDNLALISCIYVHNEFGLIQDIKALAQLAHSHRALMHSDAVQAFGILPCKVQELGLDAMSISAHKLGAFCGIGALYLKARTPFKELIHGGGQEFGKRSGTQAVELAHVFASVAQYKYRENQTIVSKLTNLREHFYQKINEELRAASLAKELIKPLLDEEIESHPGIAALLCKNCEAERIVSACSEKGVYISSGSACCSTSLEPSASIKALKLDPAYAYGALRISFDERSCLEELNRAAVCIVEAYKKGLH